MQPVAPLSSLFRPVRRRIGAVLATGALLAACVMTPPASSIQTADPAQFSDAAITDGFLRSVFGSEGPTGPVSRGSLHVRRFVEPVTVSVVDHTGTGARVDAVKAFVAVLGRAVPEAQVRMAPPGKAGRMRVHLVTRADFATAIHATVDGTADARTEASFMVETVCALRILETPDGAIRQATVFIVTDEGDERFTECLNEEMTQALGPVNDDDSLVWSQFNDAGGVQVFGVFDWLILLTLYDDRILPGMSPEDVRPLLPGAIAAARRFATDRLAADPGILLP